MKQMKQIVTGACLLAAGVAGARVVMSGVFATHGWKIVRDEMKAA